MLRIEPQHINIIGLVLMGGFPLLVSHTYKLVYMTENFHWTKLRQAQMPYIAGIFKISLR